MLSSGQLVRWQARNKAIRATTGGRRDNGVGVDVIVGVMDCVRIEQSVGPCGSKNYHER